MKISKRVRISRDVYFVMLLPRTVKDHEEIDKTINDGTKLITVEEYHRLLEDDKEILHSILGEEVKYVYLFENDASVEISEFFDNYGAAIYEAWNFTKAYKQPKYLFGVNFGEKINYSNNEE